MIMPNLSIKNVPEPVVEALRAKARSNHRSLQGELLALVTESTIAASKSADDRFEENAEPGQVDIEVIAKEHRARWPEPVAEAPASSDIIRAERDAR